MGLFSIIKVIITFPFRIFSRKKEGFENIPLPPPPELPPLPQPVRQMTQSELPRQPEPQREYYQRNDDVTKTKLDLIIAELETLKSLNQSLSERLKLIEKRLEEKERGIRYI